MLSSRVSFQASPKADKALEEETLKYKLKVKTIVLEMMEKNVLRTGGGGSSSKMTQVRKHHAVMAIPFPALFVPRVLDPLVGKHWGVTPPPVLAIP